MHICSACKCIVVNDERNYMMTDCLAEAVFVSLSPKASTNLISSHNKSYSHQYLESIIFPVPEPVHILPLLVIFFTIIIKPVTFMDSMSIT